MDWSRIRHTLAMCLTRTAGGRAEYCKKHQVFASMGDNCLLMFRKIPLCPKLISFGNNVRIASNVTLVTHDVIHKMLNTKFQLQSPYPEFKGCIELKDNVFVGANTTILPNVSVGPNVIVGACSLVNHDIAEGVYAGSPAKYICSIDEFLSKRFPDADALKPKSNDELWDAFRSKRNKT